MNARGKIPESLRSLLRSELEKAIYEAALHRDDDLIARRYMIDKWAQADIAAELGWERSTISRHIPHIFETSALRFPSGFLQAAHFAIIALQK